MARSVAMGLTLFLAVVLCAATSAQAVAPPVVNIRGLIIGGTGCNYGNTNVAFSSDYKTATAIFGGMVATTDSGLAGKRKFCQFSFYLDYPNGWSLTLGQVTGRGFANIARYSKGYYETQYYFSGQTGTATSTRTAYGPLESNFEFTDQFLTLVYSQCNSAPNLNIKTVVGVDGANAVMGVDSSDTKFELLFAFVWKRC